MDARNRLAALAATLGVALGAFAQQPAELSRAAAVFFGSSVRRSVTDLQGIGAVIDEAAFKDLLLRAFDGEDLGMTHEEAEALLRSAFAKSQPPAVPPRDAADENAWVASKSTLPRAEVIEGGVVVQRLVEGSGVQPGPESVVKVMYTGRLSDGKEFDVTEEPFALPVNNVIPGLAKALLQMRAGGTYRVFIPPAMAYGEEAVMDLIPGNSALDFTISIEEVITGEGE